MRQKTRGTANFTLQGTSVGLHEVPPTQIEISNGITVTIESDNGLHGVLDVLTPDVVKVTITIENSEVFKGTFKVRENGDITGLNQELVRFGIYCIWKDQ